MDYNKFIAKSREAEEKSQEAKDKPQEPKEDNINK